MDEFIESIDEDWEKELNTVRELIKDVEKSYRIIYYEIKKKNTGIAALLSLIPGVGHLYIGRGTRGLLIFSIYLISSLLCILFIGLITTPLIILFSIYDACKLAKDYNSKLFKVIFEEQENTEEGES
ncbi:MAG TPA: hypothetical protein EYH15_00385 [Methanothermococcus okinawensis]|uniref:TM2 domain-containing protein n=1 Tax=Methanothermococcus okinawensis TaxID=155863 RepID=A0A833DZH0_9EURY|nr:hypothetical protein [Methanococcaceae archaeon]HIP83944.1 hypothetical protein [Methanothermococcus okinawensis]HIP91537.1 hypothetical protein [Methanothermococcus okinawensis]